MLDTASSTTGERPAASPRQAPPGLMRETVLEIKHYTDTLFSFKTTRQPGYRFESGQFAMIGLEVDGRPLLRAYSMASAVYDDFLEFYSIKVPDGPLTSRLQHIKLGDQIIVGGKPTGTLLIGNLTPGRRLWLLCTGTGFAPFASIVRDPETYERFETVSVIYGCRFRAELEYVTQTVLDVRGHEFLGELADGKLDYYATVTREPYHHAGHVTDLIQSGKLFEDMGVPFISPEHDRVMICGNPAMLTDTKALLLEMGFEEGNSGKPGQFVIEKAFVER